MTSLLSPPRPLSSERHILAEGILWDEALGVVWWTDIDSSLLWQHNPRSGIRSWPLASRLASFALTTEPGVLLLGMERRLMFFDTTTGRYEVASDLDLPPGTRLNDGRCDRDGNFIVGVMSEAASPLGHFYRYTPAGLETLSLPPVAVANSICVSPDGDTLYFADSPTRRIMACTYEVGYTSDVRVFATSEYIPDGSVVDSQGCLWNAEWGGSRLTRYAPDGTVLSRINLPTPYITQLAFDGSTLFVTSASGEASQDDPYAGAVFRCVVEGIQGLSEPLVPYRRKEESHAASA